MFTNDLKRKYFFRKMFIVTDLVSLKRKRFPSLIHIFVMCAKQI